MGTPFFVPVSDQASIGTGCDGGAVATLVANTDYRANTDFRITVSAGTGVSISILDDYGDTVQSGLSTLTDYAMRIGMPINFGPFSVAPTMSVWQTG